MKWMTYGQCSCIWHANQTTRVWRPVPARMIAVKTSKTLSYPDNSHLHRHLGKFAKVWNSTRRFYLVLAFLTRAFKRQNQSRLPVTMRSEKPLRECHWRRQKRSCPKMTCKAWFAALLLFEGSSYWLIKFLLLFYPGLFALETVFFRLNSMLHWTSYNLWSLSNRYTDSWPLYAECVCVLRQTNDLHALIRLHWRVKQQN